MTAKRIRYEVLPTSKADLKADPSLGRWTITREGVRSTTGDRKSALVRVAANTAAAEHTAGRLTQLIIKGRNGKIQDERTYGADPRASKG